MKEQLLRDSDQLVQMPESAQETNEGAISNVRGQTSNIFNRGLIDSDKLSQQAQQNYTLADAAIGFNESKEFRKAFQAELIAEKIRKEDKIRKAILEYLIARQRKNREQSNNMAN